jgi:hypothetical protein
MLLNDKIKSKVKKYLSAEKVYTLHGSCDEKIKQREKLL